MKYHVRNGAEMDYVRRAESEHIGEVKAAAKMMSRGTSERNAEMYFVLDERQDIISMFHDGNEYARVIEQNIDSAYDNNIDSAYYNEEADYGRHQG